MPITRATGLSPDDVQALRAAVEAGRRPKVVFTKTAGQIAGQIGQVTRFDDPSTDEWVVVRFGRDELPFAPTDLQLPPKAVRRKPGSPAPEPLPIPRSGEAASAFPDRVAPDRAAPDRASAGADHAAGAHAEGGAVKAPTAAAQQTASRPVATASVGVGSARPAPPGQAASGQSGQGSSEQSGPAVTERPRAARKTAKRTPELTVTLDYHDGQWFVQASRGTRAVVKPTAVRAAEALKMVSTLEVPAVVEVVGEIVAAARAEAEEQAERLREQLAQVEAALADLGDVS